jgi:hypothetical protein
LAGTVEATLLTAFRFARKGAELALEVSAVAVVGVVAAVDVLGGLRQLEQHQLEQGSTF